MEIKGLKKNGQDERGKLEHGNLLKTRPNSPKTRPRLAQDSPKAHSSEFTPIK